MARERRELKPIGADRANSAPRTAKRPGLRAEAFQMGGMPWRLLCAGFSFDLFFVTGLIVLALQNKS